MIWKPAKYGMETCQNMAWKHGMEHSQIWYGNHLSNTVWKHVKYQGFH